MDFATGNREWVRKGLLLQEFYNESFNWLFHYFKSNLSFNDDNEYIFSSSLFPSIGVLGHMTNRHWFTKVQIQDCKQKFKIYKYPFDHGDIWVPSGPVVYLGT